MYSKKALTIEYVLLMMVVVALFVVIILLAVGRGTTVADTYRKYVDRKVLLDETAEIYIDNFNNADVDNLLTAKLEGNQYGLQFLTQFDETENTGSLTVTSISGAVLLYVEMDVSGKPVRYVYGRAGV